MRKLRMSYIIGEINKGIHLINICSEEEFIKAIDDINYFGDMLEPKEHFESELFEL
jgi:hypothetical protein